tara:strand:- start:2612 stop:4195 length:1584 start_codon:yes stop_codon:yes gene_type:complete
MSGGEWTGWKDWDSFKEAGIVENAVDFSDEPIIVDHAVGRTKKAIGKCWPMDAAVAYTLMKAGPDKPLKWADMVNTFTRMASVMMTRKVAYGSVPKPNTPSCGHDEVDAVIHNLIAPQYQMSGDNVMITFPQSWNSKTFNHHLKVEEDAHLEAKTKSPFDYDTLRGLVSPRMETSYSLTTADLLWDDYFKPVREYLCESALILFPHAKDVTFSKLNDTIIKSHTPTKGVCGWSDPHKRCAHHDNIETSMWAMIRSDEEGDNGFKTIFSRRSEYDGWNYDQFRGHSPHHKNVVSWEEMRRTLGEKAPEEQVILDIRESLTRMLKRNDNIVSKEGRGKNSLHSWSDWGWLAEMSAYVKNTSSKNRKAGDVVNGWVYTKINSRRSYGHEIAEFIWKPQDELKDYLVGRKEPDASSWQGASGIMTNYRFATKQDVIDYMSKLHDLHEEMDGFYARRHHCGIEKTEDGEWSVRSMPVSLSMYGRVDPEDYLTPQQLLVLFRKASQEVLAEHMDNLHDSPNYRINTTQPKDSN